MKRRSFLRSAAALFPTASIESFALSQPPPAPNPDLHAVPAGKDRFGEVRSRGFSTILFKVMPTETNAGLFIIEHVNLVKGGPPYHLHPHQDEWFYVMEGEVIFQIGEIRTQLKPGDSILGPRNVPHAFCSIGATPGRMLIAFTPAGKMEEFFRVTAVPNPPPVQDAAFHRQFEIELIGPSPFA